MFKAALLALCSAAQDGDIVFTDATKEAGLVEPLAGMMGHGGAWGDFDGDGRIDLFTGGFCDRPDGEYAPAPGPVSSRLLRNLGGKFERVAQPAVEFYARTSGAVFADLDNDGDLELYVANNARAGSPARERRCALFRNDTGKLVDVSAESGACPRELLSARNVGVFDYDGDGLLDMLVLEDKFTRAPRSVLLRNKGDLKFEIANKEAGLPDNIYGLGLAVADLNGDLRPDFFVAHSNRLFLSRPGGGYRESDAPFAWQPVDGEDWPCGAGFGDLDGDGDLDLVVSGHHAPARVRLWLNEGNAIFREATKEAGLAGLVPTKAPHVEIQDFDNDGRPDLYVSAAWVVDGKVVPLVWRNLGGARFAAPRSLKGPMVYYPAGPSGDYDNDGRLDLFLINWFGGRGSVLLRNESPKRRWLDVQVVGKTVNRMGIGSQVRLFASGKLAGFQEVGTGYGYASGQRAVCHFGLGDTGTVDVHVLFPNGKKIVREKVTADQVLRIEEP